MPKHNVGTREEWSAARKELLEREQLLDQVPDGRDADFPLRRHDEY